MDGIHDLGGKQGYGRIDRQHEDDPFHGEPDARAYGLSLSIRAEGGYPIDWFRHVRELMDPVDYLTRPYFDQWLQTALALAIDHGALSLAEATGHRAPVPTANPANPISADDVRQIVRSPVKFQKETTQEPEFAEGDSVRTAGHGHSGHTRLPAYARNTVGTIHALHGSHPLPDSEASGVERAETLYTVAFGASDLFPEVAHGDMIFLDLWESYLERA